MPILIWELRKKIFLNLTLYLGVFLVLLYKHARVLPFFNLYFSYLLIYLGCWLFGSLVARKYRVSRNDYVSDALYPYMVSVIIMLGIFSAVEMSLGGKYFSRSVFFYSTISAFTIEVILVVKSLGFRYSLKSYFDSFSQIKFFADLIILLSVLLLLRLYTGGSGVYGHSVVGLIFATWGVVGMISGHYSRTDKEKDYWNHIWKSVRAYVLIIFAFSFIAFYSDIHGMRYILLMKSGVLFSLASFAFTSLTFFYFKPGSTDIVSPDLFVVEDLTNGKQNEYTVEPAEKYGEHTELQSGNSFKEKLKNVFLSKFPDIFEFITASVVLDALDGNKSVVQRTNDSYNVEILPDNYLHFFMNLLELNEIRYVNAFQITVNRKLIQNGLFLGRFEPAHLRFKRYDTDYPYYLARILYFFDFLWKRVCPKLPFLKRIYFSLSKGKHRAMSLAEGLGRLHFCGFDILSGKEIGNYYYFIGKKIGNPKTDKNPSYGPIFKMKRSGQNGKTIFVYKLRTMHPYSEYLQQFVFERNNLQAGGKIKNDFRITSWGRVLRKLWIDELPMLYNWVKGDLKLVGVRPLSQHYLSLYTPELIEKRKEFKPGLLPPFYADLPKTLDEIMQSELRYLDEYRKSPFRTDVNYFFRAVRNILIKRARSA